MKRKIHKSLIESYKDEQLTHFYHFGEIKRLEDDELDFWTGAFFAMFPSWRGGGMGPRGFGRIPLEDVLDTLRGGFWESLAGEGFNFGRDVIDFLRNLFGDDYEE